MLLVAALLICDSAPHLSLLLLLTDVQHCNSVTYIGPNLGKFEFLWHMKNSCSSGPPTVTDIKGI